MQISQRLYAISVKFEIKRLNSPKSVNSFVFREFVYRKLSSSSLVSPKNFLTFSLPLQRLNAICAKVGLPYITDSYSVKLWLLYLCVFLHHHNHLPTCMEIESSECLVNCLLCVWSVLFCVCLYTVWFLCTKILHTM